MDWDWVLAGDEAQVMPSGDGSQRVGSRYRPEMLRGPHRSGMDPRVSAVRFAPAPPEDDEAKKVRGKSQTTRQEGSRQIAKADDWRKHLSVRHARAEQERSELRETRVSSRDRTAIRPTVQRISDPGAQIRNSSFLRSTEPNLILLYCEFK
jgi:hypothetical protein